MSEPGDGIALGDERWVVPARPVVLLGEVVVVVVEVDVGLVVPDLFGHVRLSNCP